MAERLTPAEIAGEKGQLLVGQTIVEIDATTRVPTGNVFISGAAGTAPTPMGGTAQAAVASAPISLTGTGAIALTYALHAGKNLHAEPGQTSLTIATANWTSDGELSVINHTGGNLPVVLGAGVNGFVNRADGDDVVGPATLIVLAYLERATIQMKGAGAFCNVAVAGGSGSFERAWATGVAYEAGEIVRATVASGAIGVGDRIACLTTHVAAASFATDVAKWSELGEDPDAVLLAGTQTISGVKTFSALPELSVAATTNNQPIRKVEHDAALALKANLASPALTGVPTVPTAVVGTNTTQVASTAFVQAEIAADLATANPLMDGVAAVGTSVKMAREDHKHPSDTTKANATSLTDGSINAVFETLKWDFAGSLSSTDLNNLTQPGFYDGTTMTNAPDTGWFYILHQRHSNTGTSEWHMQTAINIGSPTAANAGQMHIRTKVSNVWGAWSKMGRSTDLTDGSINAVLKTVKAEAAALLAPSTDLNSVLEAGDYNGHSLVNAPTSTANHWYYVEVQRHRQSDGTASALWRLQRATRLELTDGVVRQFVRILQNGIWSTWKAVTLDVTQTVVSDAIVDGVTDAAPSQNAVFDALAVKQARIIYSTVQDANILITPGVHVSGAFAGGLTNAPIGNAAWELHVATMFAGGDTYVHQLYITDNNNMYTRKRDTGTTWSTWTKVLNGSVAEAEVTGLTAALAAKQAALVSGTNIKTIGGVSIVGAGDVPIPAATSMQTHAFDPVGDSMANRSVHLRSDELVSAGALASWPAAGGTSAAGTQGTPADQPAVVLNDLNGFATADFTGASDYMEVGTLSTGVACTVISVVEQGVQQTNGNAILGVNAVSGLCVTTSGGGSSLADGKMYGLHETTAWMSGSTSAVPAGWNVLSYVWDSATDLMSYFTNGSANGTATYLVTIPTSVACRVGGRSGNTNAGLRGSLGEILVFAGVALSATERQKAEGYLAWKYGLQANLPAGHPFFASAPTVLDIPVHANNAAAITGGLAIGDLYRTGADPDVLCVVH